MVHAQRQVLLAAAASPALALATPAAHVAMRPGAASSSARCGLLTAQTAPDVASRLALAQPLPRLTAGAVPGADLAHVIHRNFPVAVERNFASLPAHRVAAWLDAMDDATLANLAQLYLNASELVGRRTLAIDILAQRLDPLRLARIARCFGFARVHHALLRASPGKESHFMQLASAQYRGPALGSRVPMHPASASAPAGDPAISPSSDLSVLNDTIEEIYLAFRTAPVGSTSVVASFFQTTMVVATGTCFAWGVGTTAGGWIAQGLQTSAPGVWDSLGDKLAAWVEEFKRVPSLLPDHLPSPEERTGQLQRDAFHMFDVPPQTYDDFALEGGDFGATEAWRHHVPYEPYGGGTSCLRLSERDVQPLRHSTRQAGTAR